MMRFLPMLLLLVASCSEPAAPPPRLDTSTMEPAVAELIDARYRAVSSSPESDIAWSQYAIALHGHDLWDDAIVCYERARDLAPAKFEHPYLLAYARELRGAEIEGTLACFEAARAIDSAYPPLYVHMAWVLTRAGRLEEAKAHLEKVLTLKPDYLMAHANLGEVLLLMGDAEGARRHLESALAGSPNDRSVSAAMARALTMLGETEKARAFAERVPTLEIMISDGDSILGEVRDVNRSAERSFERAKQLAAAGEWQKAATLLRITIKERPDDSAAHSRLGHALLVLGRHKESLPHLERTLELKPEHVVARTRLGIAHSALGDNDSAKRELDKVLSLAPDFGEALTLRATLHLDEGNLSSAEELFRMAEQSPQGITGNGYKRWGLALAQGSRVAEAVVAFERFVAARPKDGEGHYMLAVSCEQTGQLEKAAAAYRKGLELAPNHALAARAQSMLKGQ